MKSESDDHSVKEIIFNEEVNPKTKSFTSLCK